MKLLAYSYFCMQTTISRFLQVLFCYKLIALSKRYLTAIIFTYAWQRSRPIDYLNLITVNVLHFVKCNINYVGSTMLIMCFVLHIYLFLFVVIVVVVIVVFYYVLFSFHLNFLLALHVRLWLNVVVTYVGRDETSMSACLTFLVTNT